MPRSDSNGDQIPMDRPVFYDALNDESIDENMFCSKSDLDNEASVERFFVDRLLKQLGYKDSEIKPKSSIDSLPIPKGRETEEYKPDYVLTCGGKPRVVVDAKAVGENLGDWVLQCQGYSVALNRRYQGDNPVHYYMLTKGTKTEIYRWDEDKPILTVRFSEWSQDSVEWQEVKEILSAEKARDGWRASRVERSSKDMLSFQKPEVDEVRALFRLCHDLIWKAEKLNPSAAFFEFVKLMFVKIYEDRRLHTDDELSRMIEGRGAVPSSEVRFCVRWIESLEDTHDNPIDALLFSNLMDDLEKEIQRGNKKRIFPKDESIRLAPGTIKAVVERLQHVDMWGIDEDLNGRLFEEFLSSTMRGQELGQYFTPRSIVKLMTRLARPQAKKSEMDTCLDACCGTGGFLIEVLTVMRNRVRGNKALTSDERDALLREMADEAIYGIDAGREPLMAQIARINMYLHGDGGSRIYALDALDKNMSPSSAATPQEEQYVEELDELVREGLKFDLVLTNPPFSMSYSDERPEEGRLLKQYELREYEYTGNRSGRKSLRSSVMFLERYHDLLKPGGHLMTVMDDSVLSGKSRRFARDWLRDNYVVKAVISLPGDAFQRVGARQKTSILYLKKKESPSEQQSSIFMEECVAVGLEDKPQRTPESERREARRATREEVESISEEFRRFEAGEEDEWLVGPEDIDDRLDVKYCRPHDNPARNLWQDNDLPLVTIEDAVELVEDTVRPENHPDEEFTFLEVSYAGEGRKGETKFGSEIGYSEVKRGQPGDVVMSHINAVHGALCVLSESLSDVVISKEYSILRVTEEEKFDPLYLKLILRSPEFRAMLLSRSSGGGRHRVDWDALRNLKIPAMALEKQRAITSDIRRAKDLRQQADELEKESVDTLWDQLHLRNEEALHRLKAAGPPQ